MDILAYFPDSYLFTLTEVGLGSDIDLSFYWEYQFDPLLSETVYILTGSIILTCECNYKLGLLSSLWLELWLYLFITFCTFLYYYL